MGGFLPTIHNQQLGTRTISAAHCILVRNAADDAPLQRERVRQKLETSFPTANAAVKVLEDLGIVTEMTGQKKNRSYSYQPYIEMLTR